MKIAIKVGGTDGSTRRSVAEFADFCKFEEHHNISMARVEDNLKVRDLAWLAWHSEKRRQVTALDFDTWLGTIESLSLDTEDEKLVPLESNHPIG